MNRYSWYCSTHGIFVAVCATFLFMGGARAQALGSFGKVPSGAAAGSIIPSNQASLPSLPTGSLANVAPAAGVVAPGNAASAGVGDANKTISQFVVEKQMRRAQDALANLKEAAEQIPPAN
jgi:hypothetical protein